MTNTIPYHDYRVEGLSTDERYQQPIDESSYLASSASLYEDH